MGVRDEVGRVNRRLVREGCGSYEEGVGFYRG